MPPKSTTPSAVAFTDSKDNGAVLPPAPGPDRPLPVLDPVQDAPWLAIDYTKQPLEYCNMIKAYCWEGNVGNPNNPDINNREANNYNPFLPKYNTVRPWYHAPWMHWSQNGRECLNGLTFERPTPPQELAATQKRQLQTWACGFYNAAGATIFGQVFNDPNNPQWGDVSFPLGTCVFKVLMTDATDDEVATMKGAPGMQAVIAQQKPGELITNGGVRNDFSTTMRLLQVDFAVRDDVSPIGWVFGTFMYDGSRSDPEPWDRITPVGIMWGNDPHFYPKDAQAGKKPAMSWINPAAETLRLSLRGNRPSWGWWGRMNGPADYLRSACASCHSTSSYTSSGDPPKMVWDAECFNPKKYPTSHAMKKCREKISVSKRMSWFRDVKAPETFSGNPNDKSGDYSLQLQMGYYNYKAWSLTQKAATDSAYGKKVVIPGTPEHSEAQIIEAKRDPLRAVGLMPEELEHSREG